MLLIKKQLILIFKRKINTRKKKQEEEKKFSLSENILIVFFMGIGFDSLSSSICQSIYCESLK